MKKLLAVLLSVIMIASLLSVIPASAERAENAGLNFTFDYKNDQPMTKEVLRNYLSRAVTLQGFAIENTNEDPVFEEDLRMVQRIGAKFIGRSAFYSWAGIMSTEQIANHYEVAAEKAAAVHAADPEIILQAGIFEIAYKQIVENTAIPAYVFEAFGQPVQTRNFDWESIVFPAGTKSPDGIDRGPGFWGNDESGIPDITKTETQMYFYYQITKYIDAGYESIHMGQVEMMMCFDVTTAKISCWASLLNKGREYARTHGRRGLVMFDCHVTASGIKDGNNLIFDFFGASLKPNETVAENGALKCEVLKYGSSNTSSTYKYSYIGRMKGGNHPLGFSMEQSFTICEFDNFEATGSDAGVANIGKDCGNWGMDDINLFATQPDWYRREFLVQTDNYLNTNCLDSSGNAQYFLQPQLRRIVTPELDAGFDPTVAYTPGANLSTEFVYDFASKEGNFIEYVKSNGSYTFHIGNSNFYRANRNSDACPNGFSDEDTIRELFLGAGFPENDAYNTVKVPAGYVMDKDTTADKIYVKDFTVRTRESDRKAPTDVILANAAEVMQGNMIDIWAGFRGPDEAADISHLELLNGQYIVLKLELDDSATSLRLQDLRIDSGRNFKIELSADNSTYYTLVEHLGAGANDAALEALIKPQYEKTKGAAAYVLDNAEKANGKKTVYLKIATNEGDSQIRIQNFDVAITRNAEIPFVTTATQKFIADTTNRNEWGLNTSSPNCFEHYVLREHSMFDNLNWMIKLWSQMGHVVFQFDLEDTTTTFNPYLYVAGDETGEIKISASGDFATWYEIVPTTTVEPNKYYGDLGTTAWPVVNQENVEAVLANNDSKTVYLKYEYVRNEDKIAANQWAGLQLQGFGLSTEYTRALQDTGLVSGDEYYVADATTSDYLDADDTSAYYFDNFVTNDYSAQVNEEEYAIHINYWQKDLVAKFDISAEATSFVPYISIQRLFGDGAEPNSIKIQASANGTDWVDVISSAEFAAGAWGNIIYNAVTPTAWPSINSENVINVLLAAPEVDGKKSVYLRYEFTGNGYYDGVLVNALGISASYDGELVPPVVEPNYELGDSNGDGAIDILDLISLKTAVLNNDAYASYRDMNTDKEINALDLTELKKVLFAAF